MTEIKKPTKCTLPPEGWWCSRPQGHEGPCAARQISKTAGPSANALESFHSAATACGICGRKECYYSHEPGDD